MDALISLGTLIVVWLSASGVGRLLLGPLRLLTYRSLPEKFCWQATVGFMAIAMAAWVIGHIGGGAWALAPITMLAMLVGLVDIGGVLLLRNTGGYPGTQFPLSRPIEPGKLPIKKTLTAQATGLRGKNPATRLAGGSIGSRPVKGPKAAVNPFLRLRTWLKMAHRRPDGLPAWVLWMAGIVAAVAGLVIVVVALCPSLLPPLVWTEAGVALQTSSLSLVVYESQPVHTAPRNPGEALNLWAKAIGQSQGPALVCCALSFGVVWLTATFVAYLFHSGWGVVAAAIGLTLAASMFINAPGSSEWLFALATAAAVLATHCALERQNRSWFAVAGGCALVALATSPAGAVWTAAFATAMIFGKRKALRQLFPAPVLFVVGTGSLLLVATAGIWLLSKWVQPVGVVSCELPIATGKLSTTAEQLLGRSKVAGKFVDGFFWHPGPRCPACLSTGRTARILASVESLGPLIPAVLPALVWYGMPPIAWYLLGAGLVYTTVILAKPAVGMFHLLPLLPIVTAGVVYVWRQRSRKYPAVNHAIDLTLLLLVVVQLAEFIPEVAARFGQVAEDSAVASAPTRHDPHWAFWEVLSLWPPEKRSVLMITPAPEHALTTVGLTPCTHLTTMPGNVVDEAELLHRIIRSHRITHILVALPEHVSPEGVDEMLIKLLQSGDHPERPWEAIPLFDYKTAYRCGHVWQHRLLFVREENDGQSP